jgi:hypothetical protein
MEFEWDDRKRRTNLANHGIDFEDAIAIWEGTGVEVPHSSSITVKSGFSPSGGAKVAWLLWSLHGEAMSGGSFQPE